MSTTLRSKSSFIKARNQPLGASPGSHLTLRLRTGASALRLIDDLNANLDKRRRGLSLLEVMLALAILGVSLAAIGELMRIGSRNAESARDLTTAQILCETKMAEVATGLIQPISVTASPIVDAGSGNDWLYSIETQQVGQQGLLSVRVTVQQNPDINTRPVTFALVRWIIDPNYQSTSGTTGSSSSSSSTSSS